MCGYKMLLKYKTTVFLFLTIIKPINIYEDYEEIYVICLYRLQSMRM